MQNQCSLGSDLRKAVNRRVPDISVYCSTFNSTVQRPVWPWDVFYCSWKETFLFSWDTPSRTLYVALLWMFARIVFSSAFTVILGDFWKAKFIRGSIISSHTFVGSRIWCWTPTFSKTCSFSIHGDQETYLTPLNFRVYKISQFCSFLDFPQKLVC